ncbi:MAG: sigma-70 family RNA polymerase sigma factor [Candidatus Aminicenantes bacterium]|nr:sigma-70 family RNA polymerase sigma factor [Candidatus Aminicenantes bacterium]
MNLEAIIKDCLEGNQGAWRMLVDLYSRKVFNMAFQFTGSHQEAEDLTQDIFMKLYRSLGKFDRDKNFTAWLLALAKNFLIDEYRRTKWEKKSRDDFEDHAPTLAGTDDPERGLAEEETRKLLWSGLAKLPAEIRMAVILKEIQGKTYEEVAEISGVPVGTVKSRINRGRLQLARILKEFGEDEHDV